MPWGPHVETGNLRGVLLVTLAPGTAFGVHLARAVTPEAAAEPSAAPPLRVYREAPAALRLRRFEDRSAQLFCGRRVIVRVSVPG